MLQPKLNNFKRIDKNVEKSTSYKQTQKNITEMDQNHYDRIILVDPP